MFDEYLRQWTVVGCQVWIGRMAPSENLRKLRGLSWDGFPAHSVNALCYRMSPSAIREIGELPGMTRVEPTPELLALMIHGAGWAMVDERVCQ